MGKRRKPVDLLKGLPNWGWFLNREGLALSWGNYEPKPGYMFVHKFSLYLRFWTPYLHVWWYSKTKIRIGKW